MYLGARLEYFGSVKANMHHIFNNWSYIDKFLNIKKIEKSIQILDFGTRIISLILAEASVTYFTFRVIVIINDVDFLLRHWKYKN